MPHRDSIQEQINKTINFFIRQRYNQVQFLKERGYELDDIKQELQIGAFTARISHDPEKGKLSTLLKYALNNTISKLVDKEKSLKRFDPEIREISLDDLCDNPHEVDENQHIFPTLPLNNIIVQNDFRSALKLFNRSELEFLSYRVRYSMHKTASLLKIPRPTLYDLQGRIRQKLINAGFENYFRPHADSI